MFDNYDVIVIGTGAAGLMCSIEVGKRKRSVCLIEHTSKIAEKIRISGGGRCNLQICIVVIEILFHKIFIFLNLLSASMKNYLC